MLPILISVGKVSISSFGFFLATGFLFATFLVWRLARAWEFDEEKTLDLVVLTFFGGLIFARIFFVALHLDFFTTDISKMVLIIKYPGLSFWGGFLGGALTLYLFTKRFKMNFLAVADMAAVGLIGGLVFGNLGCLMGGCANGVETNSILGVKIVGLIGKRLPIQAFEAIIFMILLFKIWPQAIRFHPAGKVVALSLVYIGMIKLVSEYFLDVKLGGYYFAALMIFSGMVIFYLIGKKNFKNDLKRFPQSVYKFLTQSQSRNRFVVRRKQNWYNKVVNFNLFIKNIGKVLRRANVKPTPKNIRHY